MEQWYYAKGGQQTGPMGLEAMRDLVRNGTIDPAKDLVWNPGMTDWVPASEVSVLSGAVSVAGESALEPAQPFAYPIGTGAIEEIVPGSEPIIPTACVKRAWDLTVRHIGPLLLISLLYFVITAVIDEALGRLDIALGLSPGRDLPAEVPVGADSWDHFKHGFLSESMSIPMSLVSYLVMAFFMLGFTRIALNVVSGKPFGVGMLFGGGKWLLHGYIGLILYYLMISLGLVLFIFPGIYLMLRFGMYQNAIVDKNLSVIEAFKYSSRITAGNKMNLFVISLFSVGIMLAGCMALVVGILFAFPMMWLMWTVAYRWLQYGGRAVLDDPATGAPLLAAAPE